MQSSESDHVRSVSTAHGAVTWKEIVSDEPVAQVSRELSEQELIALERDSVAGHEFVARYVSEGDDSRHPLDAFDAAFSIWLHSVDQQKESAEHVIRIIGAALGSFCISHLGVRWAVVADSFGEEMALVRDYPTTRGFVFSPIRYRIEDQKTDFIYALFVSLETSIKSQKEGRKTAQPGATDNPGDAQ